MSATLTLDACEQFIRNPRRRAGIDFGKVDRLRETFPLLADAPKPLPGSILERWVRPEFAVHPTVQIRRPARADDAPMRRTSRVVSLARGCEAWLGSAGMPLLALALSIAIYFATGGRF
jgi:hypothetical protein